MYSIVNTQGKPSVNTDIEFRHCIKITVAYSKFFWTVKIQTRLKQTLFIEKGT